jgi:cob(I)alamin adenosyltransferase
MAIAFLLALLDTGDEGTTNVCSVNNHSSDDTVPCATRLEALKSQITVLIKFKMFAAFVPF